YLRPQELGLKSSNLLRLPEGSYNLIFPANFRRMHFPFLLGSADLELNGERFASEKAPEGFVFIPEGYFFFGSKDPEELRLSLEAQPQHRVYQQAFMIAINETTFGEWLQFLDTLSNSEKARYAPHDSTYRGGVRVSQKHQIWGMELTPGSSTMTAPAGRKLEYPGRQGASRFVDWLKLPVSGIDLDGELAYLKWLEKSGKVPGARLCTEREFERAARGADTRSFT